MTRRRPLDPESLFRKHCIERVEHLAGLSGRTGNGTETGDCRNQPFAVDGPSNPLHEFNVLHETTADKNEKWEGAFDWFKISTG
jgi:hypothetical protein